MYLTRSEYDRGVNTFSPEGRCVLLEMLTSSHLITVDNSSPVSCHGRLFQVEYAIEAVKLGSTAVGIQTSEGIILAVEKRLTSTLLEPSSVEKIMEVDFHIGAAVSGLIGGKFIAVFFCFVSIHVHHEWRINSTYLNVFLLIDHVSDGRTLVDHARVEAQNHRFTYDEVIGHNEI